MATFPLLVPLLILIPSLGTFINFFWGAKMGERAAGYIASGAAVLTFILSVLIVNYLNANHGIGVVVDPFPIFDGWIRIGANEFAVNIPWQFRVDTLTATMLLVVTGVGSLIHIYSIGYIHGDPKAPRFFAYLNMFLAFMLILVTANNYLMMFVGWEGVGLCSFLLIGYWWDKPGEKGWENGNAARKAMILNRIGDFGILIALFLTFWTFGTLDYYAPGETANTCYQLEAHGYEEAAAEACGGHGAEDHGEDTEHAEDDTHSEETAAAEHGEDDDHSAAAAAGDDHSDDGHGGDDGHGAHVSEEQLSNANFLPSQLGVFAQAELLFELEPTQYDDDGVLVETSELLAWYDTDLDGVADQPRSRDIQIGPWTLDVSVVVGLIILFLLLGAAGKSAQIPLFVWLPDAMAGPTPVSALMHAATMVTAGVYLLVRSATFLELVPEARFVIAVVGAATALVAGIAAVGQWDIKRVLAFSTVSQLGFMVAAVGIGAYVAAIFHLATHAVFKALLFLGSGSIIHGVEHGEHHVHEHGHDDHHDDHHSDHEFDPQDMRNMGGLAGRMPVTFITYLAGTFALAGLPIFAGFWSKDEILVHAFDYALFGSTTLKVISGQLVFGLLTIAAFFTAFYMWRQIQMVFYGKPRSEAAAHAPESTPWMTVPLAILAITAVFVGLVNVPYGAWPFDQFYPIHAFGHFLESAVPPLSDHPPLDFNWLIAIGTSVLLPGFAIFLAHSIYAGDKSIVEREGDNTGTDPLYKNPATRQAWVAANNRLYWDDFYHAFILRPYERIGAFLANALDWDFWHDYFHNSVVKKGYDAIAGILSKPIDIGLIDAIVNGVAKLVNFFSGRSRGIQTGYVRTYAVALFFGVLVVIVLMLLPLLLNG